LITPLSNGIPYCSTKKEIDASTWKEFMNDANVLSVLFLPVIVEGNFYGLVILEECRFERIWKEDEISILASFANSISGAIERKDFEKKIEYLSFHDQLTGLYNRRFFEEEVKRLDTSRNLPISIIMADLNGLKLANDAFGHSIGDQLLIKVAEVIKDASRVDDIISRFGGDEFMILLPHTPANDAESFVNRMREAISKEPAEPVILSVSFGFDTKTEAYEEMSEIFKKAEDNMYRRKLLESSDMKQKTIKIIMKALYEKKAREKRHSERVSTFCKAIGVAMELRPEKVKELTIAGLMHDIGKVGIETELLNKADMLEDFERIEIKRHAEIGYRILSSVNEFSQIAEIVLSHHERWDGTGYPKSVKAEVIPLGARIIAIADAYEAMTSDRPYRAALSQEQAIEVLKRNAGLQFDPNIAKLFVEQVLQNQWENV